MADLDTHRTRHLNRDDLAVNPRLARRLPPDLAWRYRALPVAEESGRITVAMADPDDAAAREAIEAALGTACCAVRGNPAAIEALLRELWPQEATRPLRLLVCVQAGPAADELQNYAQAIGSLLDARLDGWPVAGDMDATLDALTKATEQADYDLIILGQLSQTLVQRLLSAVVAHMAPGWRPTSLLLARRPRWPLKRLLLVMQGQEVDNLVVDWVVRLARPSAAAVTVLRWVLPTSSPSRGEVPAQQGLNALLTADTALGQQMRRVSQRLVNWEIESRLRFCQGPPGQRIHRELAEGNYDLIAVAAELARTGLGKKSHLGELTTLLLCWADQPVLIVGPTIDLLIRGENQP
ncbi:MAG: universal stress protein [Anaerolineae bacterium]|nr:MAG: universal stress protein [Anaerolineae bacterium]